MRRRDFMKTSVLGAAALAVGRRPALAAEPGANAARLPRRPYGKGGVELSIIGFPGLALRGMPQEQANRLVAESVERGVNYFDVAPAYGDAEERLGPALEPHRKDAFLACKTMHRTRQGAEADLRRSLERLRTDHVDLYQLHALRSVPKDVDAAFAQDGAMAFLQEQRKAGRIRFLGLTAHTEESAIAAMERFPFDSILFPISFGPYLAKDFGRRVLEAAAKRGTTVLAMKGLCRQRWPKDDPERAKWRRLWYQPVSDREEAGLALRFTLSQAVAAAVPPADEAMHRLALAVAPGVRPITEPEVQRLRALAATLNPLFPGA